MKYMIGLNAAYGFASAFVNSYVNGEVVPMALDDLEAKWLGLLTSWSAGFAAVMSLVFKRWSDCLGKGNILILGAVSFIGVAISFVWVPRASDWTAIGLVWVYSLMGFGRATFEGTLKATFADFFSYEKEGGFANIIIQNGLSGALGFVCKYLFVCVILLQFPTSDLCNVIGWYPPFGLSIVLFALLKCFREPLLRPIPRRITPVYPIL